MADKKVLFIDRDGTILVEPQLSEQVDSFEKFAFVPGAISGLKALSVRLGAGLDDLHVKCERLDKALAKGMHEDQIAAMRDLRHTVDALEHLVDDARWPLPKYREMLFIY